MSSTVQKKFIEVMMISYSDELRTSSWFIDKGTVFSEPIPRVLPPVIPDRLKSRIMKAHKYVQFDNSQKFNTLDELIVAFKNCDWDLSGPSNDQPMHMLIEAALDDLVENGSAFKVENDTDTIPANVAVVERSAVFVLV